MFPNGMNDDQVDALSQALNYARSRGRPMRISSFDTPDVDPGALATIREW